MNELAPESRALDLRRAAALIALAIGMVTSAVLLYSLIDILLVLFIGIIVAAAIQPLHVKLTDYGVPRAMAVLLIYLLLLFGLLLVGLLVAPILVEQVTAFVSGFPEHYADAVESLRTSRVVVLRVVGRRLPELAALAGTVANVAPSFSGSVVDFASGLLTALVYVVTVLAVGFYWTLEVPRIERLVVSFAPAARRTEVLNIWHEIEFKLGAFVRGQGLAMLAIGAASAIGYALIGLPNVFALAVLAGLLEAVPLIGPILATVPAILVALPLGPPTVLLVIGWSVILQGIENNILIPRIMGRAVGMSSLVGLLAVMAFGTLYGIVGVFIAIPLVAAMTVLLDRLVINAEPAHDNAMPAPNPLEDLRARVQSVRQQMRRRFRERNTRIGIDPHIPEHVVDAVDLQLEKAVERVATMIATTADAPAAQDVTEQAVVVGKLADAIAQIEQAVAQMEVTIAAADDSTKPRRPEGDVPVGEMDRATRQVGHAVDEAETAIASREEAPAVLPTATADDAPSDSAET